MAIQESDIMDFGNGIIGDDTFDVWRKKTNSLKGEIDLVNTTLTNKINTDVANLSSVYIPQSGSATSVSTALQFTNNITLSNSNLIIGSRTVSESAGKLSVDGGIASTTSVEANTVQANSNLSLGTKTYSVPSSPAINNAVLVTQTDGTLSWQNVSDIFTLSGGLSQTTAVFEEVMPVGSVIPLAGEPNDPNFLLCEGGTVSKLTYKDLFDVIEYSYDTGLSGDQFRLPDYRGRVLVGTQGTSVTFPSSFGVEGGTETLSTSGHTLTIDEIPAHAHQFYDDRGNRHLALSDANLGASGDAVSSQGPNENGNGDTGVIGTSYTGGGANGGIAGGTTTDGDLSSLSGTSSHSHNITASNRVQPYVTVKWYIKAIKNSKVDFKIDIANSGLKSTTFGGDPQTLISPVNETIQLDVDTDNTSIALVSGKVAVKSSPTIQGTITTTGPDFKLKNDTRLGGNSHSGRALVHGNGNGAGDPILNGYNRKVVTTINDSGVGQNNDTLIINYSDISPNSVGDYSGGVIINGMKAIMFEDGSILQSGGGSQKGNFKKATETESGKHHTVSPQYGDAFCYIDDEDDIVIGGNGNGTYATGAAKNDGHTHRTKFMLPDDEKVDKLYKSWYNTHVIAKSGKSYSVGYGYSAASTSTIQSHHSTSSFYNWTRSFCESDNCKMSKIVQSGDIKSHSSFALDDLGYFWGHGVNQYGCLANGTTTHSDDEDVSSLSPIIGKREALANSETSAVGRPYNLATNRRKLSHVINPMLDSSGNITTTVSTAVSLLKVTDATHVGSWNGSSHPDTVAILGEDKRVYVAGYCNQGQAGAGVNVATQSNWSTVQTSAGVPLENITKLYSGGEDAYTYFVAIDENYDVWGWGDNGGKQFATGNGNDVLFARKIWDSSAKNRRANYIITNNAGSSDANATVIIASHQNSAGAEIDKEFWTRNTAGSTMVRLSHTVFNTTVYSIQDLYFSSGNESNFYYVLARNKTNNKLELFSSGANDYGQCGWQNPNDITNFANTNTNGETEAYRVSFRSDLLEKVVNIHCCRQYSAGGNTHIHLSDGRIFACGLLRWSFDRIGHSSQKHYKFSPIPMD